MNVGISTASYYSLLETEDAVREILKFNVSCCEVFLETYSEYSVDFGKLVKSRLNGMSAVSMHARTQHFETDIFGKSPRQKRDGFDWLRRALDAGHELGVKYYVYHGPMTIRSDKPIAPLAEDIERANELATERGILLCWETVSWCAIHSPERLREAAECCPNIGFVIDIKQCIETGRDPAEFVRAAGSRAKHVHAMDYDARGVHALPGKGVTDFAKLKRELDAVGYGGSVILEPYAVHAQDETAMRESIEYLRRIFEELKDGPRE